MEIILSFKYFPIVYDMIPYLQNVMLPLTFSFIFVFNKSVNSFDIYLKKKKLQKKKEKDKFIHSSKRCYLNSELNFSFPKKKKEKKKNRKLENGSLSLQGCARRHDFMLGYSLYYNKYFEL